MFKPSTYSIFKKSKNLRQRQSAKPSYSSLEDRKLLAAGVAATGTITLNPLTSVLNIRGTDAVEDKVYIATPNETEVRVNFNGDFCVFLRSEVSLIRFNGFGGDDIFNNALSNVPSVVIGGAGNDTLLGGSSVDRLFGESGNDTIIGGRSGDAILGGSGDDTLLGSEGDDSIFGNDGTDTLRGGIGNDTLRGDTGDDLLAGGVGDDLLIGGLGNDLILGELGNDTLNGGDGNDELAGGEGNDGLYGGDGDDTIFGQDGIDRINGNDGIDTLSGGLGDDYIQGGAGDDLINGDGGADRIFGQVGNDVIFGSGGNDFILGGQGDDQIRGGADDDTVGGESGNDVIDGNSGVDLIFGGDGDDLIRGGDQNDFLFGQLGRDVVLGMDGNDRVVGNDGNDYLVGGEGNDIVVGNAGNDRLFGNEGDDDLYGGDGEDGLFGGVEGSDRLFGEEGSDRLLILGSEEVVGLDVRDARVEFRDGSDKWNETEITVIDDGLNRLQARLGNNRLARDPLVVEPIIFLKERTLPQDISISRSQIVNVIMPEVDPATGQIVDVTRVERRYVFADWIEADAAENELRRIEVPRTISLAWADTETIRSVVPSAAQTLNRFTQLSAWRTTSGGSFFRVSEDNMFFYRRDALFADDTGRINPTQDWASAWQLFFTPGQESEKTRLVSKLSVLDQLFTALEIF